MSKDSKFDVDYSNVFFTFTEILCLLTFITVDKTIAKIVISAELT